MFILAFLLALIAPVILLAFAVEWNLNGHKAIPECHTFAVTDLRLGRRVVSGSHAHQTLRREDRKLRAIFAGMAFTASLPG